MTGMRSMRMALLATIAACTLGAAAGVSAASAAEPWWHLTSFSRPTDLRPGQARDEVKQLTENLSEGGFYLVVFEPEFKFAFVPYNASEAEMQSAWEQLYGAGNVQVKGGATGAGGTGPYVYQITFAGALADRPVASPFAFSPSGGEVTVTTVTQAKPDGYIHVHAANLGDASARGEAAPITISDKLPEQLEAVSIEAKYDVLGVSRPCSLETLSCDWSEAVAPYSGLEVQIAVVFKHGATIVGANEATISGGEAKAATVRAPVAGSPGFGVSSYEIGAEEEGGAPDTQAGSHPFQLTTTLMVNQGREEPVALAKDLRFKLPAGLVGNPQATPACPIATFLTVNPSSGASSCPAQTAVGVASSLVSALGSAPHPLESTIRLIDPLFNLEPARGEPARFGFYIVEGGTAVILDTSVRTGEDYGVTVAVKNIPQTLALFGSEVTFWGVPGDPRHDSTRGTGCLYHALGFEAGLCELLAEEHPAPLLSLPTSCTGALQSAVEADSWKQKGGFGSYPLDEAMPGLVGCNRLSFGPEVSVAPDVQDASTPTGLTVGVHVPQELQLDASGLAESNVKDTTVTLPEGVTLNPSGADGLEACSEAEIGFLGKEAGDPALNLFTPGLSDPFCPNGAKIGTVTIRTPLLPNPLEGAVYLADPAPGGEAGQNPFDTLLSLYLVAQDPVSGTLVKLAGQVRPDPVTGQLVSTFRDTPQLPFEDLTLHFFGGARAPLATPGLCDSYTTRASITPWSGNPPSTPSSSFRIASGPNGSACADPLPFAPELTAGSTNIQAGAFTPFVMTMSRQDGNQDLDAIKLHMPPGLLGTLSSVRLCGEPQADQGTCGPESLIGHTIVSVGLGGDPYTVTGGRVYITGPYDGAPYGLSIVNPAKAGPFDLGQVVVRARIEVDPMTAALTVTTDSAGPYAIPQILDGIPLQIKHVNVTIDREGFTFNPTDCEPLRIDGGLTSSQGAAAGLSVPFQVTNCARLAFKPRFNVYTSGRTSRANGASLDVKLAYPKAPWGSFANIASVKVDLPKQLPSRLSTLQKACPDSVFDQNPAACPVASRVGTASASTPIIPVPLSGPAFFVSHGGQKFPELVIVLSGYGVTVQLHGETFIKDGITSSTFHTIPDVPVESFELKLPQDANSALAANGRLCNTRLRMPTAFTAQNGTSIHSSTPIAVTGCPRHKTRHHKHHKKHRKNHHNKLHNKH